MEPPRCPFIPWVFRHAFKHAICKSIVMVTIWEMFLCKNSILVSWWCHKNYHQVAWINRNLFSQFWKPEVPNQGISSIGSSGSSQVDMAPHFHPSFWWLLAILGITWLVDASLQTLPPSSCCLLVHISVSSFSFLIKTLALDSGPTLICYNLISILTLIKSTKKPYYFYYYVHLANI